MKATKQKLLKNLPAVDAILRHESVAELKEQFDSHILTRLAREVVRGLREDLTKDRGISASDQLMNTAVERLRQNAKALMTGGIKKVINATGVILHTGLGRAVLSPETRKHLIDIANGYCSLEIDLKSGKRGDRQLHASRLLQLLTGAEAACVVNNNAAAVMLVLNTLAEGKEVIVSRGELVEIGGSFRLPEIIKKSGARLIEVGTTNKTRARDYVRAITAKTAILLKVHQSNFRIKGFTEEASLKEIVEIGGAHEIPVVHDLGGGILISLKKFGLPEEPVVEDSIKVGVALATFSGDKIIGGPQAGIIVGKKKYIDEVLRNPLMRVVRSDKLALSLLECSLRLFLKPQTAMQRHSILRMLSEPIEIVETRARKIAEMLKGISDLEIVVATSTAEAGSGALPVEPLPSFAVGIKSVHYSDAAFAAGLRQAEPAVIAYTRDGRLWLDARTIAEDEIINVVGAVKQAHKAGPTPEWSRTLCREEIVDKI
jgi:L-seryl-tRNA(Ser) seleniumtransferase